MTVTNVPELSNTQAGAAASGRRTDFDTLRVLICGCVILAHAMLIFAFEPRYHLKSDVISHSATVLYEFMRITTMALFFVLAGWAALGIVRKRGARRLLTDRHARVLVPLGVGVVVFGSAIKYIELAPRARRPHGRVGCCRLLARLAGTATRIAGAPRRRSSICPRSSSAAHLVAFDGYWPFLPSLYKDGANFFFFAWCFAIGAGIAVRPGFETRLRSETPHLLILMLVAFAGVIYCGEPAAGRVFVGVTAWAAIGPALGYAARIKPKATPALHYLSEASLALYILHHLPLLAAGAVVLPLDLPVWIKIALIALVECDDCARVLPLAGQALPPHAPDDGHVRQASEEMKASGALNAPVASKLRVFRIRPDATVRAMNWSTFLVVRSCVDHAGTEGGAMRLSC